MTTFEQMFYYICFEYND